jgi:hypothetical protein
VYGPWNVKQLAELDSTLEDFSIQCIKTKHSFSFKHYSYVITRHDKKILVAGDAKHFNVYHIGPLDHITTEDPLITLLDRPGMVVEVQ